MDEHQGSAPGIPVWKTGVYLSTPMLGEMACQPKPCRLEVSPPSPAEVQRAKAGVPCWSCTSLCAFANRRLRCSANGIEIGSARERFRTRPRVCAHLISVLVGAARRRNPLPGDSELGSCEMAFAVTGKA